jgi:catechol 2,3-dioxygenase
MKIKALGHVVLQVTDRQRAEHFYGDFIGFPLCGRFDENGMKMAFFTLGNHHDFAVMEVTGEGGAASDTAAGLDHVAFNIGTTIEELREAKQKLDEAGISIRPVDHEVTKLLYFQDPDGNGVELYVDASEVWRQDPQRVAQGAALEL